MAVAAGAIFAADPTFAADPRIAMDGTLAAGPIFTVCPILAAGWSLATESAFAKHLCGSLLQSKFSCESVFAAGPDSAKSV